MRKAKLMGIGQKVLEREKKLRRVAANERASSIKRELSSLRSRRPTVLLPVPVKTKPPKRRRRHVPQPKWKVQMAASMLAKPTVAEAVLRDALAQHPWLGFRSQVVLHGYIPDFYSRRHRIAVEADGGVHDDREAYDTARDRHLAKRGVRTLRFMNIEILADVRGVVARIIDCVRTTKGTT